MFYPFGCVGAGNRTFGEGLGLIERSYQCSPGGWEFEGVDEKQVYHNKAGVEWGEPIDMDSLILDVSDIKLIQTSINIYPNPVNETLNISLNQNATGTLQIVDVSGKTVLEESFQNKSELQLNVVQLAAGMYVLKIKTGDKSNYRKVLKQ
ncbi:MAG: T9SS type A sorting domain-containing protein [Flavobacteriales bacterium]|nr:T9SS type A sorting domain-containing protein [Flavobacteriales bacterium]